MSNSRKKNSRRTDTTSSKTPSVEPAIDGLGGTLLSRKQGSQGDYIDAFHVIAQMSQTKKRRPTTESQSWPPCEVLSDGTIIHNGCTATGPGSKCYVTLATASKPEPRMSFGEQSELKLGLKHDSAKPALAYIPKAALDAEGKAFGYGANKYASWNYKNGIAVSRTLSAALRHISQFLDGEEMDAESGVHHLGCARANLAMALDTLARYGDKFDDRFKGEK